MYGAIKEEIQFPRVHVLFLATVYDIKYNSHFFTAPLKKVTKNVSVCITVIFYTLFFFKGSLFRGTLPC